MKPQNGMILPLTLSVTKDRLMAETGLSINVSTNNLGYHSVVSQNDITWVLKIVYIFLQLVHSQENRLILLKMFHLV